MHSPVETCNKNNKIADTYLGLTVIQKALC